MNDRKEKDPFAEYDKFWDELNEIDEIKDDEDYFKKEHKFRKINNEDYQKYGKMIIIGFISLFVFVFMLIFIQAVSFIPMMGMTPLFSVFSFVIFVIIIFKVLSRQK